MEVIFITKRNLTGQIFGEIDVIGIDFETKKLKDTEKKKNTYWRCYCHKCNNYFSATTTQLMRKHKTPLYCCPDCMEKMSRHQRFINHSGEIIGDIKLLSFNDEKSNNKRKYYNCLCLKCNEVFVREYSNIQKHPKMCTKCSIKERSAKLSIIMTNNKYGRLTVLQEYPDKTVKCLCDCGTIRIFNRHDLLSGHTQSCGCLQKEQVSQHNTKNLENTESLYGIKILSRSHQDKRRVWYYNCLCPICQNTFLAIPAILNNKKQISCGCSRKSFYEDFIEKLLISLGVSYIYQYKIEQCKYKQVLFFDFSIMNDTGELLGLLEYDGEQHYHARDFFGGEEGLKITQLRDSIKNDYCCTHNIPLLRIPYNLSDEQIQTQVIQFVNNIRIRNDCGATLVTT